MSKLLRQKAVLDRTGLPKTTMYEKIKAGEFPKPVPLSERSVAWVDSEVTDWIESKIKGRLIAGGKK